ncbi:hypothetical protein NDU88_002112 [Pleurodeles waltl]|uniref:Uncharacterized protein n=1 Tax=Pleurodeles waltl TaxID=8319 RepID=A0AAV7UWM6_PLEWA|nr:hypothetical protein NDU88_002112 [Pleurodeles waltl]
MNQFSQRWEGPDSSHGVHLASCRLSSPASPNSTQSGGGPQAGGSNCSLSQGLPPHLSRLRRRSRRSQIASRASTSPPLILLLWGRGGPREGRRALLYTRVGGASPPESPHTEQCFGWGGPPPQRLQPPGAPVLRRERRTATRSSRPRSALRPGEERVQSRSPGGAPDARGVVPLDRAPLGDPEGGSQDVFTGHWAGASRLRSRPVRHLGSHDASCA